MKSVIYAECHYAECHYAECHFAECHYAECRGTRKLSKRQMQNIFTLYKKHIYYSLYYTIKAQPNLSASNTQLYSAITGVRQVRVFNKTLHLGN